MISREKITQWLECDERETEIVIFAFQQMIWMGINIITFLMISMILHRMWYGILFLMLFIPVRRMAGGYHASTKVRCYIISNIIFTLNIIFPTKWEVEGMVILSKGSKITTGTILCIDIILTGIIAVLVVLNKLKLADYISLIQYVSLVFAPIVSLQSLKIIAKPVLVSLQRINEMIYEEGDSKKIEITEIQGIEQININNLNFSYRVEDEYILKEINLCLKPKDKLALIGHNGSGKTTLVKILLGYYEVGEDKVLINGIDINKIKKESLRQCIGFVPQNIFLFEMSVFENIRVGNTDMDVEEFSENLKKLQDCGFLEGIDMSTVIIDNGKNLSKGQIQQIAIARTLVKTHSLYIFDEATSYLDKAAKSALHDLLKNKIKKEICIFICHDNDFDDITNKEFILQ